MAIYNIFDYSETADKDDDQKSEEMAQTYDEYIQSDLPRMELPNEKGRFFSALAARFFFFLLLVADLIWSAYSLSISIIKCILSLICFRRSARLNASLNHSWLSFKRSLVCAIALLVAIFAPALGIMFSCMYFLMYDKDGVDEVVPASLRDQFKDFLPSEWF